MEKEQDTISPGKETFNNRFLSYLKIIHLQFDLLKTKSDILEDETLTTDIAQLESQKHHLVKQIADFIHDTSFQAVEVTRIEKGYELLLRGITVASLRDVY